MWCIAVLNCPFGKWWGTRKVAQPYLIVGGHVETLKSRDKRIAAANSIITRQSRVILRAQLQIAAKNWNEKCLIKRNLQIKQKDVYENFCNARSSTPFWGATGESLM